MLLLKNKKPGVWSKACSTCPWVRLKPVTQKPWLVPQHNMQTVYLFKNIHHQVKRASYHFETSYERSLCVLLTIHYSNSMDDKF